LPPADQIWFRKELGTLIALVGFVVLLLGTFELLLRWPVLATLRTEAAGRDRSIAAPSGRNGRWWAAFWISALVPAVTYYPAFALGNAMLPASRFLPQAFTT